MRPTWQSVHSSLRARARMLSFQQQFDLLRAADDVLRRFPDLTALLDHQHSVDGDCGDKNTVLAALIRAAQRRDATADTATTSLWLALWPGLDALYRRLLRHFRSSPEDLVSEITGRFTGEVHRIDPRRVRRIAATLVSNVERDIRQALGARWREAGIVCELPDEAPAAAVPATTSSGTYCSLLDLPAGVDLDTGAAIITERLRPCLGEDAALVVAVAVRGDTQAEAAERLGLGHDVARKRYQRSLRRLRRQINAPG